MTGKSVFGVLAGFLSHHSADLDATAATLTALLDALPVNAQTREHIDNLITRVRTSAENVAAAVENFGNADAPEPVTIRESDIETALRNVTNSGALDEAIASAVSAYMATHRPEAAADVPVPLHPVHETERPAGAGPLVGGEPE